MKKILFTLTGFLFFTISNGQTNVSGGIFTNTTWTLANSPYIVTDTVVVFPGITLTIEPGVVVKFYDNQLLEIRQGKLVAEGTAADSITFTSSSASPVPGIYKGIYINNGTTTHFLYCNFYYSKDLDFAYSSVNLIRHCKIMYTTNGIAASSAIARLDSCDVEYNTSLGVNGFRDITNCTISNNGSGIGSCINIYNCIIDSNVYGIGSSHGNILNCFIRHNQIGIDHCQGSVGTTIDSCIISNNQYGIHNPERDVNIKRCIIESDSIGILMAYNIGIEGNNTIENCRIAHNFIGIDDGNRDDRNIITGNIIEYNGTGINLRTSVDSLSCNSICHNTSFGLIYFLPGNTNCVRNNYWCTADSASTEAVIYDAYDDPTYGIVGFMPIDSACSPGVNISIDEISEDNRIQIYPNPSSAFLTVELPEYASKSEVKIFNTLGDLTFFSAITKRIFNIDISSLNNGLYIIQISSREKTSRRNFIKQ